MVRLKSQRRRQQAAQPAIDTKTCSLFATRSLAVYSRRNIFLKPSLSFAGPREYRWQGLEVPVMMGKRRGTAQIATASLESAQPAIDTKTCSFRNSLARCVQQAKHIPEAIFELRWPARIPLARPGGAGHDGETSWYGSNRNGVAGSLRSQQSRHKNLLFSQLARSLCTAGETYS